PQVALNLLNDLIILAFPQHQTSGSPTLSFFETPRAWSSLGFMAPPKHRDMEKLRKVAARAIPAVLRAEREAAFYVAENEPIDPHPHLWQQLLGLVWKMRMPPRWLIGRYPDTYAEWKDLTDLDLLEHSEG